MTYTVHWRPTYSSARIIRGIHAPPPLIAGTLRHVQEERARKEVGQRLETVTL